MAAAPHRIDVHHHFAPPAWLTEVRGRDLLNKNMSEWTLDRSLEDMDKAGVATSVLSITNPGLWFGDAQITRNLARACNEYGAGLVQKSPKRLGLFAALPMPDPDAALREIAYAYDTLNADGMHLFTSYGDIWLGNERFEPVMAELNRRKAVVHVHPTVSDCCKNLIPGVQPSVIEYGTDTTRAMLGILFSGQAVRYPDIKFIWSHAGGSAPFFAGRIESLLRTLKERETRLPHGAIHEMKRFFYDIAGASSRPTLSCLTQIVAVSQVMFGTDHPSAGPSLPIVEDLAACGFSPAEMMAIERDNAIRILPRLGQ